MNLSVVTLHRGREHHLHNLLSGFARTEFTGDLVIAEMGDVTRLPTGLPFEIKQISVASEGLPLARARNAGRAAASGSRLVYFDVDCIPAQSTLSTLADALADNDALVCAQVRYLSEDVTDGWTERSLFENSTVHPHRPFPRTGLIEAEHPGLFWSLAFAIRSETFDRLGGFDEAFHGYGGEDTDFAFRAHKAGIPILMCAEAIAFHQPHESFEPPLQHFTDIMRNATLFRRRHGVWPMQGWLDGFEALGLIERIVNDDYRIVRVPTSEEVAATLVC